MLVIRMQRTGRKGHAMFRVVVQDSRRTPTSGKVVASLGSYDPHTKTITLNKERAQFYLDHGAQPSDRAASLLKAEGVKLPAWVKLSATKERAVRNADKRRSTRPPEPVEEASVESAEEAPADTEAATAPAEETHEAEAADESAATAEVPEETSEAAAAEEPASEPDASAEAGEETEETENK